MGSTTSTIIRTIISLALIFNLSLPVAAERNDPGNQQIVENSTGLIVPGRSHGKSDFIHIYNANGSVWHKFTFYYDDRAGQFPYIKDDFRPFAFRPDYFVLALKCVRKVGDRYEVIVNERTGLRKYVKVHDPLLKYETWTAHVLSASFVGFDSLRNPLLRSRKGKVKKVKLADAIFQPVKIEGDWLMVRWVVGGRKEQYDYGWIKWKKGKALLIEFLIC